jgi:hypothetical protein
MAGKIFITRSGYDPQLGRHVKDPYLGDKPTLGACRPDVRRQLKVGDHIFVISGKVPVAPQFVMAGFEIELKIDAKEAFKLFPEHRLRMRSDGQLTGNVIVNDGGMQHELDNHSGFDRRIPNYVVGTNLVSLRTDEEIAAGRAETLLALREILGKDGNSPHEIVTRFGTTLSEKQVIALRDWLASIKAKTVK